METSSTFRSHDCCHHRSAGQCFQLRAMPCSLLLGTSMPCSGFGHFHALIKAAAPCLDTPQLIFGQFPVWFVWVSQLASSSGTSLLLLACFLLASSTPTAHALSPLCCTFLNLGHLFLGLCLVYSVALHGGHWWA